MKSGVLLSKWSELQGLFCLAKLYLVWCCWDEQAGKLADLIIAADTVVEIDVSLRCIIPSPIRCEFQKEVSLPLVLNLYGEESGLGGCFSADTNTGETTR
jgi:hypothetical protein